MSLYEEIIKDPEAIGQVVGSIIGVTGLFIGTFITIITTVFIRSLDIKREEKKAELIILKEKKEKEFNIKQEIYSIFLSELAYLENFLTKKTDHVTQLKNIENFDDQWTRVEIKVDLVANTEVRELKDQLQKELMNLAKKRFEGKPIELTSNYKEDRNKLLQAIRNDIDIFQN